MDSGLGGTPSPAVYVIIINSWGAQQRVLSA
jgi:hypothetical protein